MTFDILPIKEQGPIVDEHLEIAFSYLSTEDLKALRVVCKFWSRVADTVIYKPLSVAEGVRRVLCISPRFLAEPNEESSGYLYGVFRSGALNHAERPIWDRMVDFQRMFKQFCLLTMKWGRTPGTIIVIDKPLSYKIPSGTLTYPDAPVRTFDLRRQTETVERLQPFAEECELAALCRADALILSQEHYLDSFQLWDFSIVLLDSHVLRIYDKRVENRMISETPPIADIEYSIEDRAALASPVCDEAFLVVPCTGGILRIYNVQTGSFLHNLSVNWGMEPEASRFFTKLRIRHGYIAAARSDGRIDVFKGTTLIRSFTHEGHVVSDFDLGKETLVALFYRPVLQDATLPTTLKAWELENGQCLHEKIFDESPIHLEYQEYKRLVCECFNGQILVLDPFNTPEPPTFGRQVANCFSSIWNALCTFVSWVIHCCQELIRDF